MPVTKHDIRTCSCLDKAAMIMLSLAEEHTSKLFSMMEDDEIRDLSQRMSTLGTLSNDLVEKLFVEFVQSISSTGALVGTYESVERLLQSTIDVANVEGRMKVSSMKRVGEIVDGHPDEALNIIRNWIHQEA